MKITNHYSTFIATIQVIDDSFEYNCIIEVYREGSINFEKGSLRSIERIIYKPDIHYLVFKNLTICINCKEMTFLYMLTDTNKTIEYSLKENFEIDI